MSSKVFAIGTTALGGLSDVLRKRGAGKEVFSCFTNIEQHRAKLHLPDWYLYSIVLMHPLVLRKWL